MFRDTDVFKIRDGVDIYLIGEELVSIYFMNTRKRIQFKANKFSILLLEAINGKNTIYEIKYKLEKRIDKKIEISAIKKCLEFLVEKGVIVENNEEIYKKFLSKEDYERYNRQLNFLGDFLPGATKKYEVQKKIQESTVLVFGCGAIGGWISTQLAMCGVANFILVDRDEVKTSDISRHIYFKEKHVGKPKVDILEEYLQNISSKVKVSKYHITLNPYTDINSLIDQADFVINTADEPYIGHTSMKISRYCVQQRKAHYIAGGFDAHLASTGELIIPGVTPCVDCYAEYFNVALKDWKPKAHPVKDRYMEIGGLSSMSLFSSSYAVIEIIKYIGGLVDFKRYSKARGEFLFDSLNITYLDIKKNPNCRTCGGVICNET